MAARRPGSVSAHRARPGRRAPGDVQERDHQLAAVGYTAKLDNDGLLGVTCHACNAAPVPDHSWFFTVDGTPSSVELDDAPYSGIEPCRSVRRVEH